MKEYRDYQIKPYKAAPSNYIVVTAGRGGKIPDVLGGLFTTYSKAMQFIDQYLDNKPVKDISNDKEVSKARSK